MPKEIEKIGQMNYLQSFLQMNLIKGFKYIDKAGELVNNYTGDKPLQFEMNLDGLVIEKPKSGIDQIKISPHQLWMKILSPGSLDQPVDTFIHEAEKTLGILGVNKISRIGWRNYFAIDLANDQERSDLFNRLLILKNTDLTQIKIDVKAMGIAAAVFINQVHKKDEAKTPGVLFDVDVFQEGEATIQEAAKSLRKFRAYLADDKEGFLSLVNSFLCGKN